MPAKVIILPPNLVKDKRFEGKSVYSRDYCHRHRHGRRATTPTRSYTSLLNKQKKLVGDMSDMQLSDHFTTHPAAIYGRQDFQDVVENTRSSSKLKQEYSQPESNGVCLGDTQEAFLEKAPSTLQKIEEAWLDEVDTTKRERGNLYGLAGRKMSLHPRKAGDKEGHPKTKSLPGLDKWLSTANEYEKQVVHNFVSQMREGYQRGESTRPHSTPAELCLTGSQLVKPKERRSVRINSKLISPRLPPAQPRTTPSPPKTPPSPPASPPRIESSQSCRSDEVECVVCDVSTQLPHPSDGKPSSPMYEPERAASVSSSVASVASSSERPATVPTTMKDHTCNKCDACKKKLLKKMIDELAGTQLSSYEDLLKQKAKNQQTISTRMYQDPRLHQPMEDYLHPGCTFQRVTKHQKGHFTIHPDFVSENIVDLKRLRRKHEKYFGQSDASACQ